MAATTSPLHYCIRKFTGFCFDRALQRAVAAPCNDCSGLLTTSTTTTTTVAPPEASEASSAMSGLSIGLLATLLWMTFAITVALLIKFRGSLDCCLKFKCCLKWETVVAAGSALWATLSGLWARFANGDDDGHTTSAAMTPAAVV